LVAGSLDRLRENLQQQGITLDTATVAVAAKSDSAAGKEQQPNGPGQDGQQPGPQEQGGHGQQAPQDRGQEFPREFAFAAGPAAEGETAVPVLAYAASLNVVA